MNRRDPRIRQTLDRFTSTLESANYSTQESLWDFFQSYLSPCLASLNTCLEASCYPCIGARRDRLRTRNRTRAVAPRGRPEFAFDFYNDEWDNIDPDEGTGLLGGWGNDELDRLLAGSGGEQPGRHRGMNYGSRGVRRKSAALPKGSEGDPTIMPNSSMFGFLERLPWKLGKKGIRYWPSSADLQDNPGGKRPRGEEEAEGLLEESEEPEEASPASKGASGTHNKRQRSDTVGSRSTTNSLSSRGDLFPSEDEDDAVALDDEFAMVLERRNTNQAMGGPERANSGKAHRKRSRGSRTVSSRTTSTKSVKSSAAKSAKSSIRNQALGLDEDAQEITLPSMEDLKREEDQVRETEEAEVGRKRREAQTVAFESGLPFADEELQHHQKQRATLETTPPPEFGPDADLPTVISFNELPPDPDRDSTNSYFPPQPEVDSALLPSDEPETPGDKT